MPNDDQKQKRINTKGNTIPVGIALIVLISFCQYQNHKELEAVGHWTPSQVIITRNENINRIDTRSSSSACLTTSVAFPSQGNNDVQAAVDVGCESINDKQSFDQAVALLRNDYPLNRKISIVFDSQKPEHAFTLSVFNNLNDPNNPLSELLQLGDIIGFALIVFGLITYLIARNKT